MDKLHLFTIGFTKKSAESFFLKLTGKDIKRVIDVRLNNVSQLSGFAKRDDLCYFLKTICGIDYIHMPELAPTQQILDEFKKNIGDWSVYEKKFMELITTRQIEKKIDRKLLDYGCLLCSEAKPDNCHRRIIAEYFNEKFSGIEIVHII